MPREKRGRLQKTAFAVRKRTTPQILNYLRVKARQAADFVWAGNASFTQADRIDVTLAPPVNQPTGTRDPLLTAITDSSLDEYCSSFLTLLPRSLQMEIAAALRRSFDRNRVDDVSSAARYDPDLVIFAVLLRQQPHFQ